MPKTKRNTKSESDGGSDSSYNRRNEGCTKISSSRKKQKRSPKRRMTKAPLDERRPQSKRYDRSPKSVSDFRRPSAQPTVESSVRRQVSLPEIIVHESARDGMTIQDVLRTPDQAASISFVESRIDRLESMLEVLVRQGTQSEGMSRTWYHSLTSYPSTWSEWKVLIVKTFPDHVDYATVLRKMLNRTKQVDETMTNYYFSKLELLRTCQISGRHAVSCLINGITDVMAQNGARAGRYVTPEALYEEYLSMLREGQIAAAKPSRVESVVRRPPKLDSRHFYVPRRYSPTRKSSDIKDVQCFNSQLQDSTCKDIMETLTKQSASQEDKEIRQSYCLKEKRLYRITPAGNRWVVPKSARRRILMYYHDGAGHFAVDKTLEAISTRYWFPAMRSYVKNYINSCLGCMYNKVPAEISEENHQNLESLRDDVSRKIETQQQYQKEYYDKRHAMIKKFTVGQHVVVQANKTSNDGKSRKFEPRYKGSFVVMKVLDNDRHVVNELPGSKRSRMAYTGICPSE
ncbi:hypothetical protein JTB14_023076 [Gonioctena quinquepunctata]|nr:hypothetical protein JTB14_023076 [Gonioctena quinquepunctata]